MAVRLQSVTEGPLGRQMLRFSLPLMLSNVLQVLFNMSDIAVVGQFAGSAALGAVGSTTILVTLFTGLVIGMGGGVNVLAANYFGAKRSRDLGALVHTAALVCLLEGLLLLAVGVGFARGLLAMLHTKDELMTGAVLYLRLYFLCMPAAALFNYGSGVLCAVGETKRPLYYLLGAGVLNVLLNLFFVIVCRLNVAGVALASVIAQYVSAALVLAALVRPPAACGGSGCGWTERRPGPCWSLACPRAYRTPSSRRPISSFRLASTPSTPRLWPGTRRQPTPTGWSTT